MFSSRSLRSRFLLPLLIAASVAALAVAWVSWSLGKRWAMDDMAQRYQSIRETLRASSFPLSPNVVDSLAKLTETEWATLDDQQRLLSSTLGQTIESRRLLEQAITAQTLVPPSEAKAHSAWPQIRWDDAVYYARAFPHSAAGSRPNAAATVTILFDKHRIDTEARRAALLPLATGLSTVAAISALMIFLSARLINRLRRLELQVETVATGNFESRLTDEGSDEVGRLAARINQMAEQLSRLWQQLHQEQGTKLLHQIAAGMAHQLRNTLTGARMAIELHQGRCQAEDPGEIQVALRQLEIAEDYVNRLLTLGSPSQNEDQPMSVAVCIEDVRSTHQPIAEHLNVALEWEIGPNASEREVSDGPSLTAAVSNLVLNAMHAGKRVVAEIRCPEDQCLITICDDGPGIDPAIAESVFEPFVSSRPEGMGLGLPLVRRAAERLGGEASWRRESDATCFQLTCRTRKVSRHD